jgi:2-methylcitrate dehydratase PrpD
MTGHEDAGAVERALAEHVESATWDALSGDARMQVSRALIWWAATALEGATDPGQQPLLEYVRSRQSPAEATVLGASMRTSAEFAALLHGRAAKAWEHEDKYWVDDSIGPGVAYCVVSAAVAAAEAAGGVSGPRLGAAIAGGVDLVIRLLRPLGLGFVPGRAGQHAAFVLGTYGAAVAAGKISGFNREQLLDVLGLAHMHAAGNFQAQFEGRGVALQGGLAARNGVESARLASFGLQGPHAAITGRAGLYESHFRGIEIEPEMVLDEIATRCFITEVAYKAYPCGVVAHPAIDAMLAIRDKIDPSAVASVAVLGPESLLIMAEPEDLRRSPATPVEAQFSIPWAIACALRDGDVSIDHYAASALADSELRNLAASTRVIRSSDFRGSAVEVRFRDGSTVRSDAVVHASGHPMHPLGTERMARLLAAAAVRVGVHQPSAAEAVHRLQNIDAVTDIGEVMHLLTQV